MARPAASFRQKHHERLLSRGNPQTRFRCDIRYLFTMGGSLNTHTPMGGGYTHTRTPMVEESPLFFHHGWGIHTRTPHGERKT